MPPTEPGAVDSNESTDASENSLPEAETDGQPSDGAAATQAVDSYYDIFRAEQEKADKNEADYKAFIRQPNYSAELRNAFDAYSRPATFRIGQLVQWKSRMKNRRFPDYGAPAVVVGFVEDPPTLDEDNMPVSERHDLILGWLDGEPAFRTFVYPSVRFTAWDQ